MERLINKMLLDADELKPTYDIEDIAVANSSQVPIIFSKELVELFKMIMDSGYFVDNNLGIRLLIRLFSDREVDVLNEPQIIKDLSKYVDDNVAQQIIYILKFAKEIPDNYGGLSMYVNLLVTNTDGGTLVSIKDMIALLLTVLGMCFTVDDILKWSNNETIINTYISLNGVSSDSGYISKQFVSRGYVGQYKFLLSDEEKKNIIGSIWNCIIDIIAEFYCNKIEDEGGEVNG